MPTTGEHLPTMEECPLFDATGKNTLGTSLNPASPDSEKAPPKLSTNTPPPATPPISAFDLALLFTRFEARQGARDLELQRGMRREIDELRAQVDSLSKQLHEQSAASPDPQPTAVPPATTTFDSPEAQTPPPISTHSIGTYLAEEHRVMEPELAPSRHIESITPLSLLAPKLISITSRPRRPPLREGPLLLSTPLKRCY